MPAAPRNVIDTLYAIPESAHSFSLADVGKIYIAIWADRLDEVSH